jgi:hypothetical protein
MFCQDLGFCAPHRRSHHGWPLHFVGHLRTWLDLVKAVALHCSCHLWILRDIRHPTLNRLLLLGLLLGLA